VIRTFRLDHAADTHRFMHDRENAANVLLISLRRGETHLLGFVSLHGTRPETTWMLRRESVPSICAEQ